MVNLLTLLYGALAPLSSCGPTVRRPGQKSEDQPNSCSPASQFLNSLCLQSVSFP